MYSYYIYVIVPICIAKAASYSVYFYLEGIYRSKDLSVYNDNLNMAFHFHKYQQSRDTCIENLVHNHSDRYTMELEQVHYAHAGELHNHHGHDS